ncbi:alpha-galactosidase [Caldanaerobius fijiensis DSM 17918]|uniref:Alpha-galactosidase n=1 Tax=Caldanaerobius fijiensis DSM 17918 TaxID=1121256 RepID=A0A1M4Y7I2_9THEO|nr:alpha-glucosidase/alpha-galactosidase [Caldanaerobius fijiensis]SHF01630.1 alpha-galactosidase [Caldanaerobius fijiensis DSM 17918]
MNKTKIVFIGAGSMSFGLSMFKDIFTSYELAESTLSLVDIDEENLERMYKLALKMNEESGLGMKIEATTERKEVLPGAQFVVNSLAIERCALWKQDFEIPKKYGIRHTLGENGGPGGLFFTMRTIPVIMDILRDMEKLCPDAYFLNFSNPESRIILALGRYTKIRGVGLCHGVFMGRNDVARIMGLNPDDIDVFAAGLNHFQWLLEIRDKKTGEDLYPLLREKEKTYDPSFMPLSRKLFRVFGKYPSCSDDHIGEYLPYGWEAGEEGYPFDEDEKNRILMKKEIEERINGTKPLRDWFVPSGERAVHVITGILNNKKQLIESGIVYNNGVITNLPADAAIEVPIMVDKFGIHPIAVGDLPPGIAKLLTTQVCVQQLAVDAAINGSKELAMQALLIDPVINSTQAAEKILEELWEINKPYIRKCV